MREWPRFLRVAQRHRVIGLAHQGLTEVSLAVPPEIRLEIGSRASTFARQNLAIAAEALRLQRLFDDAKLPVLFVKGSSLAVLAFGNLGLSGGEDIDLLVPREVLPTAMALVARAGYRRFDPPPDISETKLQLLLSLRKDVGFVHEATRLPIELHWRLFLNPHAMSEASIWAASRIVPLTTGSGLRTLGEEDLFAYLCMHGALHWWNQLKWLADVNALLVATSDRDVSASSAPPKPKARGVPLHRLCYCAVAFFRPRCPTRLWLRLQGRGCALAGEHSAERAVHRPGRARAARCANSERPAAVFRRFLSTGAGGIDSQNCASI